MRVEVDLGDRGPELYNAFRWRSGLVLRPSKPYVPRAEATP
jgi:hypothetical protein